MFKLIIDFYNAPSAMSYCCIYLFSTANYSPLKISWQLKIQ